MTSFEQELESAWIAAIAPREDNAPTVISTFAGMGGSSLGYKMAGFAVRLAVEWDADAVETYHINFPSTPIYHGDIAQLTVSEALKLANIESGQLDVLDGSPPCQGFSIAGKRRIDDLRNRLFREYIRLLRGLRPRAFVMENVSGLIMGKMKHTFVEILRELRACDYRVIVRLVDASYLGVPQKRRRLIFLGIRSDLHKIPVHPLPQTKALSVYLALIGCKENMAEREWLLAQGKKNVCGYRLWPFLKPGQTGGTCNIDNGKAFSACRCNPNICAPTLVAKASNIGLRDMMHWSECRRFTTSEYQRLFAIPDQYRWPDKDGNIGKRWSNAVARMGNCVPPFLIRAVAIEIMKTLYQYR